MRVALKSSSGSKENTALLARCVPFSPCLPRVLSIEPALGISLRQLATPPLPTPSIFKDNTTEIDSESTLGMNESFSSLVGNTIETKLLSAEVLKMIVTIAL